jgi:hypothetical protein
MYSDLVRSPSLLLTLSIQLLYYMITIALRSLARLFKLEYDIMPVRIPPLHLFTQCTITICYYAHYPPQVILI